MTQSVFPLPSPTHLSWDFAGVAVMLFLSILTFIASVGLAHFVYRRGGFYINSALQNKMHMTRLLCMTACAATSGLAITRWLYNTGYNFRLDYSIQFLTIFVMYVLTHNVLVALKFGTTIQTIWSLIFTAVAAIFAMAAFSYIFPDVTTCKSFAWVTMSSVGVASGLLCVGMITYVSQCVRYTTAQSNSLLTGRNNDTDKIRSVTRVVSKITATFVVALIWDVMSLKNAPGTCDNYINPKIFFWIYVILNTTTILFPVWTILHYVFNAVRDLQPHSLSSPKVTENVPALRPYQPQAVVYRVAGDSYATAAHGVQAV